MNRHILRLFTSIVFSLTLVTAHAFLSTPSAMAQCSEVISGLRTPLGITQSNQNNLIVSESGTLGALHSGRISIVDPSGTRRTLLDGLPAATNDAGDSSGPAGVFMRGRTLYVAIGIGNTFLASGLPNLNPASPIFSSVLAIHFSASVEKKTLQGFTLPLSAQQTLASGQKVTLSNVEGDKITWLGELISRRAHSRRSRPSRMSAIRCRSAGRPSRQSPPASLTLMVVCW